MEHSIWAKNKLTLDAMSISKEFGGEHLGFTAKERFDRERFTLQWLSNQTLPLRTPKIKKADETELTIQLEYLNGVEHNLVEGFSQFSLDSAGECIRSAGAFLAALHRVDFSGLKTPRLELNQYVDDILSMLGTDRSFSGQEFLLSDVARVLQITHGTRPMIVSLMGTIGLVICSLIHVVS